MNDVDVVLAYHRRTKHHPFRYARSLGFLDWDTQPDPFLRFDGAPLEPLDRGPFPADVPFADVDRTGGRPPAPLDARAVADLLFHAVALSAWKEFQGSRWSLRCNPSSGNLHPTETYLVSGAVAGLGGGAAVRHYRPDEHALEVRRPLDPDALAALVGGTDRLLVGLTSIPWRESWKYGERAYRYCQHDVGHAVAAVAYAAAALGWEARAEPETSDAALARLLRSERSTGPEAEHVDLLLSIGPPGPRPLLRLDLEDVDRLLAGDDLGTAAPLSRDHHDWPVIEEVSEACAKPTGAPAVWTGPAPDDRDGPRPTEDARGVYRRRRSAVDMDGETSIPRATFLRMVRRLRPAAGTTPWSAFPWRPGLHPVFLVHRVDDLAPGLYVLVRDDGAREALRESLAPRFAWEEVDPAAAPSLFRLEEKDVRSVAQVASCQQAIAADGAFAVAMLAEFAPRLRAEGAWFYRALHWEAGAIGHVLYLEAEAAGIRSTGIGCFFDDLTHEALGLADERFQVVYHFTVGGPVDDPRLVTRPAYP